jgi:hypothetical protein
MTERTNDEKWRLLLDRAHAERGRQLRTQHPEREPTPDCPPLPLFLSQLRAGDWEPRYQEHFATGCPYCRRQLQIAARLEAETAAHRGSFRPVRSRQALATPRRGDPTSLAPAAAGEQRWHLEPAPPHRIDTDDGPAYRLPEAITRRSYNVAEGVAAALRIDLLLEPGPQPDTCVPVVEVTPGPHRGKEPLRLVLRFAEDCVREFVIRPHPVINKASLRSDPVEPIPTAVVAGWTGAGAAVAIDAEFSDE